MTIGERLRMIRKKENLVLKEVGELCGITDQSLSRYERDKRYPENEFLKRFVTHFKLNTDWVLFGTLPIYKVDDKEKDAKKCFIEFSEMIKSKDVPGIDPQKVIDDITENYLVLNKYMLNYPIIRKGIFQFFFFLLKPMIDNHPEISDDQE
jgi:transcriptional regulator with XRE-family HTH domain